MTAVTIRAAAIKDISSIVRTRLAALTEEENYGFSAPEFTITYTSTKELRKAWNRGNRLKEGFEVFLAEDEGKMAGFIVFKTDLGCGYIENIVVAEEKQGKGIGRALVMYVEGLAKSKGCHFMRTDTTENVGGVPWKSFGFWIKMGYEDVGERLCTNHEFKEIPLSKSLKCASILLP